MADTSARLMDDIFPENTPVRQWVLSLPIQIRYRLAYDEKLLSDVLRIFLRVVNSSRLVRDTRQLILRSKMSNARQIILRKQNG